MNGNRCNAMDNGDCIICKKPRHIEILLDGWYLNEDIKNIYIAYLQTGIRVPVTRLIFESWKVGFDNLEYSNQDIIMLN